MFIGRLAEEFHCKPSDAYREWLRLPAGFLEDIIEGRAYARAKALIDAADTKEAADRLPTTPMFELVKEITEALVLEEIQRRDAADDD